MTVDAKLVQFHKIAGKTIVSTKGAMGKHKGKLQEHRCCCSAFDGAMGLSGNQTGEILQWDGNRLIKPHKAHNSAVWQIICIENQTRVVSGANDCKLILWDSNMKQLQAIDLRSVDKFRPEIRSIDFNESTKTFLVGTRGAEIIEIDAKDKKPGKALVSGHVASSQDSELCGLACHPTEQLFITCGSDKKIKIWEQNKLSFSLDFAQSLYSVDWSPCGKFVIVGDN